MLGCSSETFVHFANFGTGPLGIGTTGAVGCRGEFTALISRE